VSQPYAEGIQVGRPKLVRFAWDNVSTLRKDSGTGGGLQPLANGVTGFSLTYFDTNDVVIPAGNLAANLGCIRRIIVTPTTQSSNGPVAPCTFTLMTSARTRNLSACVSLHGIGHPSCLSDPARIGPTPDPHRGPALLRAGLHPGRHGHDRADHLGELEAVQRRLLRSGG